MTPGERNLRYQIDEVDCYIGTTGNWDKVPELVKSYRSWLIKALNFIQLKNFDRQS
jgi:hypothetical protein